MFEPPMGTCTTISINSFVKRNMNMKPSKGRLNHQGQRQNVSAFAAAYTSVFGARIARLILEECLIKEPPCVSEMFVANETHERPGTAPDEAPCPKRQRHSIKGPPRGSDIPAAAPAYGKAPTWESLVKKCSPRVPRVGNFVVRGGDELFDNFQMMVPELQLKLVILCRGTERFRVPGSLTNGESMPWRKTIVIDRATGQVIDKGPPENWTALSRIQQTRRAGPARLSITLFGDKPGEGVMGVRGDIPESSQMEVEPGLEMTEPTGEAEKGWPPRISPKSGPHFEGLDPDKKADLRRIHANLGHPHPGKLARFLSEQGADEAVVRAARDYQCDACVENQAGPKLSHPASLHVPRDFNDCVGCDGAYWTNRQGLKFHFMHFIDEATLYHVGVPSGRTTEEQIQVFESVWLNWAGPCKTLYLDPAGEYINDQWHDFAQKEGIKLSVAAGESHWQIGRAESHGRIVKQMLTAMDIDEPISNFDQFRKSLRHVFAAKNALSNVNGYSPEQALLGKSCAVPASLVGDNEAATHSLAESNSPEGILFRESLRRRECARKAFLTADNSSALRRAVLRRPRKEITQYQSGDWVLYWRKLKGNSKGERGRWHGPGQVIATEYPKVVWVSHGGYLVRASPQQLRPASLREHLELRRDSSGRIMDEQIKTACKNYVQLEGIPEEEITHRDDLLTHPARECPGSAADGSQPEGEIFPSAAPSSVSPCPSILDDPIEPPGGVIDFDAPVETPVPNDGDDLTFGDDCELPESGLGVWEITLEDGPPREVEEGLLCESPELLEWSLIATGARKQRVEVQWKNLGEGERQLFQQAKEKEIDAWVKHETVKRVAKGTLRDDQIMRCRWILTWKSPAPGTSERRAKARLVVLGFEDPQISSISSDAPTLSKDGKQLILQQVASNGWRLVNFDIATAFLKGQGDGRALGLHAPKELKEAIGMEPGDQCSLLGGAYGRADAPILWYKTLRQTLESLGFVASPFDGCVFSLITKGPNGPKVRGCLGLHVDDGIGGGDEYFGEVIERLRKVYDFGAYNEGDFEFCGVRYYQWDDGSIEMGQDSYIQKISPIDIPRKRRQQPKESLSSAETQSLRQICGSLQYAAVHTRPDISAKVGELQAAIPCGRVEHLILANRVLFEAKSKPVNLMIVPIAESKVTFCAFSDASFESGNGNPTRQGTLIFTTDGNLAKNQRTVICPMAWSSRKVPRVVRSTLSAESVALGSTLDRLSWLRVFWEWLKNPGIDWSQPDQVLRRAPHATVATDCKSVYDLSTKTSTPSCSEYRTTLECLLIRERLRENCGLRWVNSKAMLADCLTKSMDGDALRQALMVGQYALFDEHEVLKERADKRSRLKWINLGSNEGS